MDDRELRREKTWARIHLVPLLEAELDRDLVRRDALVSSREAEIMKGKPDWAAADLKAPVKGVGKYGVLEEGAAEPVYHTKRYVKPSLVFLPPNNDNVLDAQWWRGSKILTKVLPLAALFLILLYNRIRHIKTVPTFPKNIQLENNKYQLNINLE